MLTVNEIENIRFSKGMSGYKAAEVDDFIDQCSETVRMLSADKADLEKKLEVLADKLVEYRNDEDNIRTALLSAQKMGDTIVREAKHKAGLILDDAKIKADRIMENASKSIKDDQQELQRIRREITNFKARMLSIYREHLSLIDILPEIKDDNKEQGAAADLKDESVATEQPEAVEKSLDDPAFEPVEEIPEAQPLIDEIPSEIVLDIPALKEDDLGGADFTPQSDSSDKAEAKHVSRFGDLKFGDGYDIAKDSEPDSAGFFRRHK